MYSFESVKLFTYCTSVVFLWREENSNHVLRPRLRKSSHRSAFPLCPWNEATNSLLLYTGLWGSWWQKGRRESSGNNDILYQFTSPEELVHCFKTINCCSAFDTFTWRVLYTLAADRRQYFRWSCGV